MAKKTATKKTATKKIVAKRSAPTKTCPDCNKAVHAAKAACDCGYKFPAKKKSKKKAARSVASISTGDVALSQKLADSIKIVEKAGGLKQAQQMLAAVKELEKLK
jgi:hypothetical protein